MTMIRTIHPPDVSSSFFGVGFGKLDNDSPGLNLCPQFKQVIIILLLPIVPASKPIPPVNIAPPTALVPLNPFLLAVICVDEHFGHLISGTSLIKNMFGLPKYTFYFIFTITTGAF